MRVTFDYPVYDKDDNETVYRVTCYLTPYDPGRTYGPPEKCYPPEGGECEIEKVELNGVEVKDWEKLGFDNGNIEDLAHEAADAANCPDEPERDEVDEHHCSRPECCGDEGA